jgi:hypothetical protein
MAAADTGFLVIFLLLIGAMTVTNFIQSKKATKTNQTYFAVIYLAMVLALMIVGLNSFRE